MILNFDDNGKLKVTILLVRKNLSVLGQIRNVSYDDIVGKINFNSSNEFSFVVYKNDVMYGEEPLWDEINDFKYVFIKEFGENGEYFDINVQLYDNDANRKVVTCKSAGESELSQVYLYDIEINTEADILRDDYKPTVFYNASKPEQSLLNRILYKTPQYSIGHVDYSLFNVQRVFTFNSVDLYSALTNTIAQEVGCLFKIDVKNKLINAYDLESYCEECGYRGEYEKVCPKCGSTDIKKPYGNDTLIYIDTENLANEIQLSINKDEIKNCFRITAGDDDMTSTIVNINPTGSQYIYYFSDEMKKEMSEDLANSLNRYEALVESYTESHEDLITEIYEKFAERIELQSGMMPEHEQGESDISTHTAQDEIVNLTKAKLGDVCISFVSTGTSLTSADLYIKNYCKAFVHSGRFKIEVNGTSLGSLQTSGIVHSKLWTGTITLTNYSNEEDTATTPTLSLTLSDDYEKYIQSECWKTIAGEEEDNKVYNISDLLKLDDNAYEAQAVQYSLSRLHSFSTAIQSVIDVLIEAGHGSGKMSDDLYNQLYRSYYNKLKITQRQINARNKSITKVESEINSLQKQIDKIHNALNLENFLKDENLYNEFLTHRREGSYENSNYISDGLNDDELIENAKQFIEKASNELKKSAQPQYTISMSLINLLALSDYNKMSEDFDVGIYLHARIDGELFQLRLISIGINYGSIENIDVEFSNVSMSKDNQLSAILSQASSMATSYGYYANQVDNSYKSSTTVSNWLEKGFNLTNNIISNNDKEEVLTDKHGILLRSFDDEIEGYQPTQMKLTHSTLAITDDDWETVKTAIGKVAYRDPSTNKVIYTYGIIGETIIGDLFVGRQLQIYDYENNPLIFTDADGNITIGHNNVNILGNVKIESVSDIGNYFDFGNEHGLVIGKRNDDVDSSSKLVLSNEDISFVMNENYDSPLAQIAGENFFIKNGQFKNELTIGEFRFVPRQNGSLDFKKVVK